ncbi:hypothetical protein [Halovenus amylolytica]|uniref:hypothetical protein n=1 Tax=Halovenus amylolytica TaxID=2500550 RepID=UPI003D6BB664
MAEPYDLIHVPPCSVDYMMTRQFSYQKEANLDLTHIIGGDWDRVVPNAEVLFLNSVEQKFDRRRIMPLSNCCFYRSVVNHIRNGKPWEETEFNELLTDADRFQLDREWEYNNENGREWRFDQLDRLACSMREDGYKTQRECREADISGHDKFNPSLRSSEFPPESHEVAINIGRDGKLILDEGRHRFMIARALELDSIPVRVFVRHEQWQQKRSEAARAAHPSEVSKDVRCYLSHPDMSDVANFDMRID